MPDPSVPPPAPPAAAPDRCQPIVDILSGPGAADPAGEFDLRPPSAATEATCHLIDDNRVPPAPVRTDGLCHPLNDKAGSSASTAAVLELRVRNHPGTMSHITGLFARRGFNLEAIVCVPVGDAATSAMLLLVADEPRLEQVERQLAKLFDVLTIRHRPDLDREFFSRLVPVAAGA
jgi:acetolactate synthase I/III small subunit